MFSSKKKIFEKFRKISKSENFSKSTWKKFSKKFFFEFHPKTCSGTLFKCFQAKKIFEKFYQKNDYLPHPISPVAPTGEVGWQNFVLKGTSSCRVTSIGQVSEGLVESCSSYAPDTHTHTDGHTKWMLTYLFFNSWKAKVWKTGKQADGKETSPKQYKFSIHMLFEQT